MSNLFSYHTFVHVYKNEHSMVIVHFVDNFDNYFMYLMSLLMISLCYLCRVFIYTCIAVGDPVIKSGGLGSHQLVWSSHIFVPVTNLDLGFHRFMSCSLCFWWVQSKWEVIVGFVVTGGIDDHRWLKISFHNWINC